MNTKIITTACAGLLLTSNALLAATADFELPVLPANSAYYGADGAGGFTSGGATFANSYFAGPGFEYWEGFAISNKADGSQSGFEYQFNSITGDGAGGSSQYGVGFAPGPDIADITLPAGASPVSVELTNVSYAYYSMLNGDMFAKKFGGASGNDPDYLRLTITGLDAANQSVGAVEFYLADYTFANNADDYIVDDWTSVDLSSLAGARKLSFSLASTDNGMFGMNTPAYFAIDDLVTVPEPASLAALGLGAMLLRRRARRAATNG